MEGPAQAGPFVVLGMAKASCDVQTPEARSAHPPFIEGHVAVIATARKSPSDKELAHFSDSFIAAMARQWRGVPAFIDPGTA
jgi:hypothetical protein